jgi:hypothetical protein
MEEDYADGVSAMAGPLRPSPRLISNTVAAQSTDIIATSGVSDLFWQWGQFLDHDLDLTEVDAGESANIPIPAGDSFFDPLNTGTQSMPFNRSTYDPSTGTGMDNPRQQRNDITGWIDASNVYGSDPVRAAALRTNDGTGRLETSVGNLLPFNLAGLPNAGGTGADLFLAGDVRANEQIGLTAMHTLFVREHNRLATHIAKQDSTLTGDEIYEMARRIVGAQMQVITYNEFVPALLGPRALSRYRGYDPTVGAGIMNVFSAAAFRLGHSLLSRQLLRLDKHGEQITSGHVALRDTFFAPELIIQDGIDSLLRGMATQVCQGLDVYIIDEVRNFLFGAPGAGGFDLASLNIQRGRDHGLPTYNEARQAMGLPTAESFSQVSSRPEIQARLAAVYSHPDEIDLWVGGLAEDPVKRALVGELFFVILREQFEALRDGDRFWYQRSLSDEELVTVEDTTLAKIIRRNTDIRKGDIQDEVMKAHD